MMNTCKEFAYAARSVGRTLIRFYGLLTRFLLLGGKLETEPTAADDSAAEAYIYSLCLEFWLWDKPHYRNGSWGEDSVKNLRNLCIPGTGIPLSFFAVHKAVAMIFLWFVYPMLCLGAAVYCSWVNGLTEIASSFEVNMLTPQDWFSYWRLNCRIASAHAFLTKSPGYTMENKWDFLVAAKNAGIPVSPWLDVPALVAKDRNEEGGMGIHFFNNAAHGGKWILQPRLENSPFLRGMLPETAPLSTLRVITSSTAGLQSGLRRKLAQATTRPLQGDLLQDVQGHISALSCVFRAGRAGAATDHSSILFDVGTGAGVVGGGTTNEHWYNLWSFGGTQLNTRHSYSHHPDCGAAVSGNTIPDLQQLLALTTDAHARLLPDVPLAGWDVALTPDGPMLLEVNLSCNFFRGSFDRAAYWCFVRLALQFVDAARQEEAQA